MTARATEKTLWLHNLPREPELNSLGVSRVMERLDRGEPVPHHVGWFTGDLADKLRTRVLDHVNSVRRRHFMAVLWEDAPEPGVAPLVLGVGEGDGQGMRYHHEGDKVWCGSTAFDLETLLQGPFGRRGSGAIEGLVNHILGADYPSQFGGGGYPAGLALPRLPGRYHRAEMLLSTLDYVTLWRQGLPRDRIDLAENLVLRLGGWDQCDELNRRLQGRRHVSMYELWDHCQDIRDGARLLCV